MGMGVVPEKRAFEWDGGAFLHDVYRLSVQIFMGIAQRKKPELAICSLLSNFL